MDTNEDGVQDPNEPGVGGVTVTLWTAQADGTPIMAIATDTTATNGTYEFTGLSRTQNYVVQFPAVTGQPFTSQNAGGSDFLDSDVDTTTGISDVVLLGGQRVNRSIDAGVLPEEAPEPPAPVLDGIIGNRLFVDSNEDGLQTPNEPGVVGATVNLWTADAAGTPIAQVGTTTTAASGIYEFTGLSRTTTYVVQFVDPTGEGFTTANVGTNDFIDSDADANGISDPVTLGTQRVNRSIDAGVLPEEAPEPPAPVDPMDGIFGNRYFVDTNENGLQDPNEPGVVGATVNLWTADAAGNPIAQVGTTTTAASGLYEFTGLSRSTTYVVQFVDPTGDGFTTANVGSNDFIDSDVDANGISDPVTLGTQRVNRSIDAGAQPADSPEPPAPVNDGVTGNRFFVDTDGNGAQDPNEPGVVGATVNLWTADAAGNPIAQVGTTTTGASGLYTFTGLSRTTTYVVQFVAPNGEAFTVANAAMDNIDSDADANGISDPFVLGTSMVNNTIDAGLAPAVGELTYEYTATCIDGRGAFIVTVQNGSAAAAALTLSVTGQATKSAIIAAGANGFLSVTGRPDGTYTVVSTLDGATIVNAVEIVDCAVDPVFKVIADAMPVCVGTDGRVVTDVMNMGNVDIDYEIIISGAVGHPPIDGSLVPGQMTTQTRSGRPDGTYTVTVVANGQVVSTQSITVACD